MVPFIDVMLVLLIIFMVTAPMLTPGNIDVPTAGKSSKPAAKNIAYVLLNKDGSVIFKTQNTEQAISLDELQAVASSWKAAMPSTAPSRSWQTRPCPTKTWCRPWHSCRRLMYASRWA